MTKQQAKELYFLTSQSQWTAYIELQIQRLTELHKQLETAKGDNVTLLQGQILELRKVFNIRQNAEDFLKKE